MQVEPAGPDHAAVIAALNQHVHEPHLRADPDHFRAVTPEEAASVFASLLAEPSHIFLLAGLDTRWVGYVWAEDLERTDDTFTRPSRQLYIHHIAVAPDARRAGVGRAMVAAVEEEARRRGISRMGLSHWTFNDAAARFFRELGYEAYNVRMRRDL